MIVNSEINQVEKEPKSTKKDRKWSIKRVRSYDQLEDIKDVIDHEKTINHKDKGLRD